MLSVSARIRERFGSALVNRVIDAQNGNRRLIIHNSCMTFQVAGVLIYLFLFREERLFIDTAARSLTVYVSFRRIPVMRQYETAVLLLSLGGRECIVQDEVVPRTKKY